jgi:hypothetical protein
VSNLSDLIPAGASAKQLTFTDSGSGITTKKPVIVESDGDVTQVAETSTSVSKGSVDAMIANQLPTYYSINGGYDTNVDVHFFGYSEASDYYPKFSCLTLSGSTLTVQSTTTLASNDNTGANTICTFHPPTNLVVALTRENMGGVNNFAQAITIASGGGSITTPTRVSMGLSVEHEFYKAVYDEDSGWIVAVSMYNSRPYIMAYKPSGTGASATVSFGASSQLFTDTVKHITLYYDKSQNKIVAGYTDDNQSNTFYLHAVSVNSGTGAMTIAARQQMNATATDWCEIVYDETAQRGIFAGQMTGDYFSLQAIQLNSDDTFTMGALIDDSSFTDSFSGAGATVVMGVSTNQGMPIFYHPALQKTILFYRTQSSSYLGSWPVTCTGSTLTVGTRVDLATTAYSRSVLGLSYDSDTSYVVIPSNAYYSSAHSLKMQAYRPAYTSTNLTAQAFVGIADSAISASAAGSVIVQGGTISGLSSLTTGSNYYVQSDGTFGTSASTPSVKAGLAISTTSLLLNGDS